MQLCYSRMICALIAVVFAALVAGGALAAPPANDNFANAQTLIVNAGSATGNNTDATKEAGEPNHAWNRGGKSIWFKYTAVSTGVLTINCSGFDTLLAVYQGSGLGSLSLAAANDDNVHLGGSTVGSKLTLGVQPGVTYYLAVDGKFREGEPVPSGPITLDYAFGISPATDNFATDLGDNELYPGAHFQYYTATNVNTGKQLGEPNHAGNAGGRSIWFKLSSSTESRSFRLTIEGKSLGDPGIGIGTLLAVYQGTSLANLVPITSTIAPAFHTGSVSVFVPAGQGFYLAVDGFNNGSGAAIGNFLLSCTSDQTRRQPDVDRDGKTEIAVFRPSTGVWYLLDSIAGNYRSLQWGQNGDVPLFNHWDDDDRPDYTVVRPSTTIWHTFRSFDNSYTPVQWGLSGDIPLTMNEFKNGATYCYQASFRPANGTWFIRGAGIPGFQFGQSGDVPLVADFDGDGTDEAAVFRPSNGVWYIGHPFSGAPYSYTQFGLAGDKPVPADYDGDGVADLAVYRPSTGTWYILQSLFGSLRTVSFGNSTDIPQPADFDNFGYDEIAVFRPSNGTWYILRSSDSQVLALQWGQSGDVPQPADYDGDGKADIAVFRSGNWYIRQSSNNTFRFIQFGQAGDIPVATPIS